MNLDKMWKELSHIFCTYRLDQKEINTRHGYIPVLLTLPSSSYCSWASPFSMEKLISFCISLCGYELTKKGNGKEYVGAKEDINRRRGGSGSG